MTITVTKSKACPEKFLNLTVILDSGKISEWDWMPVKQNTQEVIDRYVENAIIFEQHQIHSNCHDEPCESCIAKIEAVISSPLFAYARSRNYGTTVYHLDSTSPTGVSSKGGSGNEKLIDRLLRKYNRVGSLSPTEDLRTAH